MLYISKTNNVLSRKIGIKFLVYLNDIIVHEKHLYDHNNKCKEVFKQFKMHNLKIQLDKYEFLKWECVYLGYVITDDF